MSHNIEDEYERVFKFELYSVVGKNSKLENEMKIKLTYGRKEKYLHQEEIEAILDAMPRLKRELTTNWMNDDNRERFR